MCQNEGFSHGLQVEHVMGTGETINPNRKGLGLGLSYLGKDLILMIPVAPFLVISSLSSSFFSKRVQV